MRKLLSLMALFVISVLAISLVSALDATQVNWKEVEVNGHEVEDGDVLAVDEGQTLEIEVGLEAGTGAEDVEVEARISGFEHGTIVDSTSLFDIQAGTNKFVSLEVDLPTKLEKDEYWLRLRVLDKNSGALERNVRLSVEPQRHGVQIADVSFSPGNVVKAGRSLLATVLLENFGDKDEDDVKVTVEIPALGVRATEFVDVKTDDHNVDFEDVPEVFLPIPPTAAEGTYEVVVTAEYDQFTKTATMKDTITVTANELFQARDKLVLTVGPELQAVVAGKTATYGVAMTNAGTESKAYVLEANAGDWGKATLSNSVVVLESGKSAVVYVDVAVNADTAAGEKVATLVVKSNSDVLETVSLRAVVSESSAATQFNLRNGLEIALIILVVVLVIIGLIIGFSRLRKDEGEEQTYY